jgi:3-phosphoshikimate 1-carboxyvinyltransferase
MQNMNITRKSPLKLANIPVSVPGDKSLSHRFVIFSSIIQGVSECTGFLEAEDPLHTMKCFSELGVQFEKMGESSYKVISPGIKFWKSPNKSLDFGNGGTGIRLSAGILAGSPGILATLTGDASLQKRPMNRILDPLSKMGAKIASIHSDGKAPLKLEGVQLKDYSYESPIASAQVKSCLIFAAMASGVSLEYKEPELSRDHTENMIRFLGGEIEYLTATHFRLKPPYNFSGKKFSIPGDISSASFFIVLGLLAGDGSILHIKNIGLNPSRIGIIEVLKLMGGKIQIVNQREECGEITGDLEVYGSELHRINIEEKWIPSIIDEIPILTIAGIFSKAGFSIENAKELRAKESDRIHAMVVNLKKLGIQVNEKEDGYSFDEITDLQTGAEIETFMDHRIAMSFSILNAVINLDLKIDDVSWVETSFPGFFDKLKSLVSLA